MLFIMQVINFFSYLELLYGINDLRNEYRYVIAANESG